MSTRTVLVVCLITLVSGVAPLAPQVDPSEIQAAFEQGNRHLDNGLYASARREFGRVLDATSPQRRPPVLQLVARCYYLEGNVEAAVVTLKRAALLGPGSDVTRQLLIRTMDAVGREHYADTWLDRLDEEGPSVLAGELGSGIPRDEIEFLEQAASAPPTVAPVAHRKGAYRTSFSERSPLSAIAIYRDRYQLSQERLAANDPEMGFYDLEDESYEVFVPDTYSPDTPFGLLVWISPADGGGLTRPDNLEVLADKKLIWVGANRSGNDRFHWYRTGLALDAAHNMQTLYSIDPRRLYVSGYSGGGRVASSIGFLYPEVFRGGAYFFGCNYYRDVPVPQQPNAIWEAGFPAPPKAQVKRLKNESRYVLVTGEHDFNRDQTFANHRAMRRDGFKNVTYIEIPAADHGYGVRGEWLEEVILGLDKPASDD